MKSAPLMLLTIAAFAAFAKAQNVTIDDSSCSSLECCQSVECLERNSDGGDASIQCLGALAELNLNSGTGQACGTCIESAFGQTNASSVDLGNLESLVDKSALKSCCGLQCPQLFQAYEQVVTGPCANTSLGETPLEALKAVVDMIEDECDSVEDWPFHPLCAPRRELSAPEGGMRVCAVHNDPHVMRFDSSLGQETCNTTGTIMLLDNDYIAITAKAEPVPLDEGAAVGGASVVTSVTFAYKSANCSAFAGNSTSLTIDGATLRARQQNTYVFREPRLWTTVFLRKFTVMANTERSKDFFSVRIMTPYHQGSGICVDGCPADEQINVSFLLSGRRNLLTVTQAEAQAACEGAGVRGAFVGSCIFDIMATGDTAVFTASSASAANDYEEALIAAARETEAFKKSVSGSGASSLSPLGAVLYTLFALAGAAACMLM